MKRYGLCNSGICEQPNGRYVLSSEATQEIDQLRAEHTEQRDRIIAMLRTTGVLPGGIDPTNRTLEELIENCTQMLLTQIERLHRDYHLFEEMSPPDVPRAQFCEWCFRAWEQGNEQYVEGCYRAWEQANEAEAGEIADLRESHEEMTRSLDDLLYSLIDAAGPRRGVSVPEEVAWAIKEIERLRAEREMYDRASTYWWREWYAACGRPRPVATDASVNEACKQMDATDKEIKRLRAFATNVSRQDPLGEHAADPEVGPRDRVYDSAAYAHAAWRLLNAPPVQKAGGEE